MAGSHRGTEWNAEIPFGGLEFLLETGGIGAARIGMRLVLDSCRLGLRATFALVEVAAVRRHEAIIVLGMLKISFGGYSIARRRSFPCERQVFFHDLPCSATDPCSRAIVSVDLGPRVPANAVITAAVRSLRISALSHSIQPQARPFPRSTFQIADGDSAPRLEFAIDVAG